MTLLKLQSMRETETRPFWASLLSIGCSSRGGGEG